MVDEVDLSEKEGFEGERVLGHFSTNGLLLDDEGR